MCDGRDDSLGGIKNTVTIDTYRHGKFRRGAGWPFKGQPCWGVVRRQRGDAPASGVSWRSHQKMTVTPSESATAAFDRSSQRLASVKSAFALLLTRVTEPSACAGYQPKKKGGFYAANHQCYGWERLGQS